MGPVAQLVFKTSAVVQPTARSVRLRRRSAEPLLVMFDTGAPRWDHPRLAPAAREAACGRLHLCGAATTTSPGDCRCCALRLHDPALRRERGTALGKPSRDGRGPGTSDEQPAGNRLSLTVHGYVRHAFTDQVDGARRPGHRLHWLGWPVSCGRHGLRSHPWRRYQRRGELCAGRASCPATTAGSPATAASAPAPARPGATAGTAARAAAPGGTASAAPTRRAAASAPRIDRFLRDRQRATAPGAGVDRLQRTYDHAPGTHRSHPALALSGSVHSRAQEEDHRHWRTRRHHYQGFSADGGTADRASFHYRGQHS